MEEGTLSTVQPRRKVTPPLSSEELTTFFEEISETKQKPAILKIIEPYSQQFIPKSASSILPLPMMELYNPEALHMDYLTLLKTCETTFETIKVRTNINMISNNKAIIFAGHF